LSFPRHSAQGKPSFVISATLGAGKAVISVWTSIQHISAHHSLRRCAAAAKDWNIAKLRSSMHCWNTLQSLTFVSPRQHTASRLISGLVSLATADCELSCARFRLSGHEDKVLECCNQIRNCSMTPGHRQIVTTKEHGLLQPCPRTGVTANALICCSGWSRVLWYIINGWTEWNVGEEVCHFIFHWARSKINGRLHWCNAVPLQGRESPRVFRWHCNPSNT